MSKLSKNLFKSRASMFTPWFLRKISISKNEILPSLPLSSSVISCSGVLLPR